MSKKSQQLLEIKIDFNDIVMRELGLDYEDNGYIYDIDTSTIYTIKEKFIKYSEEEFPVIAHNEMDMNLIENPRLMEILFEKWIVDWAKRKNVEITSHSQSAIGGSSKGIFIITYLNNGVSEEKRSDIFTNESLRVFNLICKLKGTWHLYAGRSAYFDIPIIRKDSK